MGRISRRSLTLSVASTLLMTTVLSGCGSSGLGYTEEQENIIADYAAAVVLRHDVNHKGEFIVPQEETTATEDATIPEEETVTIKDDGGGEAESTQVLSDVAQITNAFGAGGITVEYLNYSVLDSYPNENQNDAMFVMRAVEGMKLLVLKFRFTNNTGSDVALNMMEKNRKYWATVNGGDMITPQITLLLDGLNTYEDVFSAGKSEELVLVYQTKLQSNEDVQKLTLSVFDGEGNRSELNLK